MPLSIFMFVVLTTPIPVPECVVFKSKPENPIDFVALLVTNRTGGEEFITNVPPTFGSRGLQFIPGRLFAVFPSTEIPELVATAVITTEVFVGSTVVP